LVFYEEMLNARLGDTGSLKPLDEKAGLFGDAKSQSVQAVADTKPPSQYPVSWLPNQRVARAWQAVLAGRAVEP
jgi:hypothetical protein